MLEYMNEGGALMWVIAALSIAACAAAAERFLFYRAAGGSKRRSEEFSAAESAAIEKGDIAGALANAEASNTSVAALYRAALGSWHKSGAYIKLLTEDAIRSELYKWGRNLSFLEITAKTAPLLGLLGTVLGMVDMFRSLHIGGQINAAAVTGGIWKALFTTVAGLFVAIPAVFVHGILVAETDKEEERLNSAAALIQRLHSEYGEKCSEKE